MSATEGGYVKSDVSVASVSWVFVLFIAQLLDGIAVLSNGVLYNCCMC